MRLRYLVLLFIFQLAFVRSYGQCELKNIYWLKDRWDELTLRSIDTQWHKSSNRKERSLLINRRRGIVYDREMDNKRTDTIRSLRYSFLLKLKQDGFDKNVFYILEGISSGEYTRYFNFVVYPINDSLSKVIYYKCEPGEWIEGKLANDTVHFNMIFLSDRVKFGEGKNHEVFTVTFFLDCDIRWTHYFLPGTFPTDKLPKLLEGELF